MPTYAYASVTPTAGCPHCRHGFEVVKSMSAPAPSRCPACGGAVQRQYTAPALTTSASSLDARSKAAGFHKLKRLGKGEYEKQF